ncbi:hypothetical protein GQ55_2G425000 [Panicum hallii var. hallii]|uniref:Uncharacterized protein n=1 Tax=Panicum hallii var. hallii TaxID=1504633 RepID=A0A2T7EYA5_9POAL|nr:hypothetical protein GQ55_2G425000 [Panicum hallii var. hallii]
MAQQRRSTMDPTPFTGHSPGVPPPAIGRCTARINFSMLEEGKIW